MRRFCLLLLVLVLPLQMSWAAAHFCDDERMVAHAVAVAERGEHAHDAVAEQQSDAQAEKIADSCCGAAHGCHGLHHLMGQADPEIAPTVSSQVPAPWGVAPMPSGPRWRIERPNWSAA